MIGTIHQAAVALQAGEITPAQLLEQCLEYVDKYESSVRAWVLIDRDAARAEAERLASELKRGKDRGPLHGIPIGIKDIYDVFDWPTAAGSKLWAQSIARHDSPVVARLRQAGAVFVGKTVTTQYASFDPPVTKNPWKLTHTPGGSSSGSAASLATAMCLGAMGSQTGGSITRPAAYCGVCGLKPTYGLLPLDGIVPLAPSMDHPGPMARCVRDLALMLNVLAAGPSADAAGDDVADEAGVGLRDYAVGLRDPKPVRIGIVRGLFEERAHARALADLEAVRTKLAGAGATFVEVGLPSGFADVLARHRIVMAVEAAEYHQLRVQRHPEDYGPCIRSLMDEGHACSATEFLRTREHQKQLTREMRGCFTEVDCLLMPAATGPAPDDKTTGDPAFNSPWSYTGLPSVNMPTGTFVDGLPLGIQLVGWQWSEAKLLAAAAWCEQVLGIQPLPLPGD